MRQSKSFRYTKPIFLNASVVFSSSTVTLNSINMHNSKTNHYVHFLFLAPKVFSIGYPILKPFIHERTRNKIKIFGHDAKQWKAAILAEVDPEELPACYGGTMTDPDGNPNCLTIASCSKIN